MRVLICSFFTFILFTLTAANPTTTAPTTISQSNVTNADSCSSFKDCDSCVSASEAKCVFCNDVKACRPALSKGVFGIGDVCGSLFNASWATCSVNMMALIIGMSVVGGVLLISCVCCICCCCCCGNSARSKLKWMREDQANERRDEQRRSQHSERRAERRAKNDEIRKKYGLFKDGSVGYNKFQNE